MNNDIYITLAIHTYDRAVALKKNLESNGIEVKLQNVNLEVPEISSGVRVRINKKDLPLALRIVENEDDRSVSYAEYCKFGKINTVLIPIDFSDQSLAACRVGFKFASMLSLKPVLLNTYLTPYYRGLMYSSDVANKDCNGVDLHRSFEQNAENRMGEFCKQIKFEITKSNIPDLKYAIEIREGIPEDVILEYTKLSKPSLVVMATRGQGRKKMDMIGSVTAEVLDSCRVPVFTVPENFEMHNVDNISKILLFCGADQQDLLAMDSLIRLFGNVNLDITLVPIRERVDDKMILKIKKMTEYFSERYSKFNFNFKNKLDKDLRDELENIIIQNEVELLVVPNKKASVFARLFNPSMAHKILFERDMPMLVLPI